LKRILRKTGLEALHNETLKKTRYIGIEDIKREQRKEDTKEGQSLISDENNIPSEDLRHGHSQNTTPWTKTQYCCVEGGA
jgi:hypothetical protein